MNTEMNTDKGFTLIELTIVVSVIAMLAAVAIPAYTDYQHRAAVSEGIVLAQPIQKNIAEYYAWHGELPLNNQAAGVLPAQQLQGRYVKSIAVKQGNIVITYGNKAHAALQDKHLSMLARLPQSSLLSLSWQCSAQNSQINKAFLPSSCRSL